MEFGTTTVENVAGNTIKAIDSDLNITDGSFFTADETFIWAERANVTIARTSLQSGGSTDSFGGALYCDCKNLNITDACTFSDNKAASGGAMYLLNRKDSGQFSITKSTFSGNTAQEGGSISIITADSITIENNQFTQNSALAIDPPTVASETLGNIVGQGGAIFYSCIDSYENDCEVFLNQNTF